MSPKRIVDKALTEKLNIIGICDHNSAENVRAAQIVGLEKDITVLPGLEIASVEEVHILALFEEIGSALELQAKVYKYLAPGENDEKLFGEQIIVNEFDEVEGYNKRLLIAATSITLKELVEEIHNLSGLAIASHIDRESYSIIGQLGFIPDNLELDALEISPIISRSEAIKKFPQIENYPLIRASDAHFLQDIGCTSTTFLLEKPTVDEIRKALRSENGRKVIL